MATKSNQTNGGETSPKKKMTAKQREKRKRRRIIIFGVEILVLLVMVAVLYRVYAGDSTGPMRVQIDKSSVGINDQVHENTTLQGYWNIALFGLDAETDSQLIKSSHSDSIMIASINLDTGDIKLVSIYRDTIMNIGTGDYTKCNQAYFNGGAEQAIKMMNMNMDLDITDFVAIGYKGLSALIDGLGGVYIDIDAEELKHINNYQISIAEVLKTDYTAVTKTGYQLLNGMQATAYSRIRYTAGNDYRRTARQREVIMAIEEQAKNASLSTLTKVFEKAAGDIYTSISNEDIISALGYVGNYRIVDEGGFPEETMRTDGSFGSRGSCVVALDLESNVVWLHQFLFDEEEYTVSNNVKDYSKEIDAIVSPYLNSR